MALVGGAGGLAPVPIYRTPASNMRRVDSSQAMSQEQRDVLAHRSGAVLTSRSILKTSAPRPQQADANALNIAGVSDIRLLTRPSPTSGRKDPLRKPTCRHFGRGKD